MQFKICKLSFITDVHIGDGRLADNLCYIYADTLFSALCLEAEKLDRKDGIERLINLAKQNKIRLTDLFPYIKDTYYLPKPYTLECEKHAEQEKSEMQQRKLRRKLMYVPVDLIHEYINGTFDIKKEYKTLESLGKRNVRVHAAIHGNEEANPFWVGGFHFSDGAGLYAIVGYEFLEDWNFIEQLFQSLSYTGIGGKISCGMGKFHFESSDINEAWKDKIIVNTASQPQKIMLLSNALPTQEELKESLDGAEYEVLQRSGFVAASHINHNAKRVSNVRKKDLFVLKAGGCFQRTFQGDIYDVSNEENGSVYRYAKPLFWRL